jgi:uncharacterized protein (TIGR03437 family)
MKKIWLPLLCLGLSLANAQTVRFKTNLGDIDVELLPSAAPRTVENFLKYMNDGSYNNSVVHRSVKDFIWQGGGYKIDGTTLKEITQKDPVVNEFRESNVRGTIAMAKLDGNPNSATNQWFFNLSNSNATNLDRQNGGFTVFGRVKDAASQAIVDKIAAVEVPTRHPLGSPLNEMPLQNWTSGTPTTANYIVIQSVSIAVEAVPPSISQDGIVTASSFGGYRAAAPGSYLEIYGNNFADVTRSWDTADFSAAGRAPTNLEGVSVTVGGQRAFVYYVSPNQVNVQVPSTVALNTTLPVVLTARGQVSPSFPLQIRSRQGGLLAPASYKIGDRQYVYAARSSGSATSPTDGVSGGETIILYGSGFGAVDPFSFDYAGQIVPSDRLYTLGFPAEFKIAGQTARVAFQGLIPGLVGVYQFNIEVPFGIEPGPQRLEVTQSGAAIEQSLWIAVK